MATIGTLNTAQIAATSGRFPRISLAEALRQQTPQLAIDREAEISRGALAVQERAQETAQQQQVIGNTISGVGTVAQAGLAAKSLGLLPGSAAAAPVAGTSGAVSSAGPVAGEVAGISAGELAGVGGAASTAGSTGAASGGISGALATAAPIAGAAGIGLGAGSLVSMIPGKSAGARTGKGLLGAAAGAGAGFLVGGPIGAVLGGVAGGLSGGLCVIVSAIHGRESEEVQVARRFRDTYMTRDQLKGYYWYAETVVPKMEQDAAYKTHVRVTLVEPLMRYGRYIMTRQAQTSAPADVTVAREFLDYIGTVGRSLPYVRRSNGEIIQ